MKRLLRLTVACWGLFLVSITGYARFVPPGTINVTGSPLAAVSTTYGTASSSVNFSFTGSGLTPTEQVTITAPTGFEVSFTSGSGYAPSININATAGSIASTTVYVRLTATATPNTYSGNVTVAGTGGANGNAATTASTVNPLALTISGETAASKVYDGTSPTTMGGSPVLVGVLAADNGYVTLNAGGATGNFTSVNVGNNITVNASGYALALGGSGDHTAYYTLTQPSTTANITALGLTISGATASNKIYDKTNAAVMGGTPSLVGVLAGDAGYVSLTPSTTGTFVSVAVANGITVNGSGYALAAGGSGDRSGNYSLTQPSTTANITPKALTITGVTANNKVYDGTTNGTLGGAAAFLSTEAAGGSTADGKPYTGDVISVAGPPVATFTSMGPGLGITVNVTGYTVGGGDGGNYTATQPTGLTATIYDAAPASQPTGISFSLVTNTTLTVNYSGAGSGSGRVLVIKQGTPVSANPVNGTSYTPTGNFTTDPSLGGGNILVGLITSTAAGSFNVTNLSANTTYNFAIFEMNGSGGLESYQTTAPLTGSQKTEDEPLNYPTSFAASATNSNITLTWVGSTGLPAPVDYLVSGRDVTAGGTYQAFSDGTAVPGNDANLNSGNNGVVTVAFGTNTYNAWSNTTAGHLYEFQINPYTTAGILNPDYKTTPAAPIIQVYMEPSGSANNPTFANQTPTSIDVTVGGGNGLAAVDGYLVIRKAGSAPAGTPTDGITYTAGVSTIGGDPVVYVGAAGTFTDGGLSSLTAYYYDVYVFNGSGALSNYKISGPGNANSTTLCAPPTGQATGFTFSATASSATINWVSSGTASGALVILNDNSSASTFTPVPGTAYAANTDFTAGPNLGGGGTTKSVFAAAGNTVTVTNLASAKTYTVRIYEYMTTGTCYNLTSPATGNPVTLAAGATTTLSLVAASTAGTISSVANAIGQKVAVFAFNVNDVPDGQYTRISGMIFRPGTGNQVTNFQDIISNSTVELADQYGNTQTSNIVVNTNNITITNITAAGGDETQILGKTGDNNVSGTYPSTKTYYLYIWVISPLGASALDGNHFTLSLAAADITIDTADGSDGMLPSTSADTGPSKGVIDVTASQIVTVQAPSTTDYANVPLSQEPIYKATDANGNLDLFGYAITVNTTNPTNLGPTNAPTNFVNGFADFTTASTFSFANVGSSTMSISITGPSVTSANSSLITVSPSTALAASALSMSPTPLINSTVGVITGGSATNAVLGFSLKTTGTSLNLTQLVFNSSVSVAGLVQNFKLYSNTSDSFTSATQIATSSTLTFPGLSVGLSGTPVYFYLVCDVDAYFPSLNPTIAFSLPTSGVTTSAGVVTGSTLTGTTYTLQDNTPPTVQSVTIIPPPTTNAWSTSNGTSATTVTFRVTFSEPVHGITYSGGNKNFTPQTNGSVGVPIPTGAATTSSFVDVTYAGVSGQGQFRIDVTDKDNIMDTGNNPLGGVGIGNGDFLTSFTSNLYYTLVLPQPGAETITVSTGTVTSNSIQLSWVGSGASPVPTNYLVLGKTTTGGSYPAVADGHPVADALLVKNVPYGTNTVTFTGLNSGTSYDFIVYTYALSSFTSGDNIDFETTSPGADNNNFTQTAALSWMNISSTAPSISSTMDNSGNSASVLSFKLFDDGQDPILPNVMNFFDNGTAPETITFTLREALTAANGSALSGFTSSSGTVASAIYSSAGPTITLTSVADGQWTSATTISYSGGGLQFATLGLMEPINAHALTQILTTYMTPGSTTYTVPPGVTSITVEAWGGGGSAGGWDNYYGGASQGGGGGGYSRSVLAVTPGNSYSVTIGAGGPAITTVTNNLTCCTDGIAGGQTNFGPGLVVANGGTGGASSAFYAFDGTSFSSGLGIGGAAGVGNTAAYPGGNGGNGGGNNTGGGWLVFMGSDIGGSGGSSAGTSGPGFAGPGGFTGTCAGCTWGSPGAPAGGGAGGQGREGNPGFSGAFPGGGGGGTDGAINGAGGNGQMIITAAPPVTGTSDWAADDSPTKFNKIVFTQGAANNIPILGNWQNVIAGAELNDGTNFMNSVSNPSDVTISSNSITFSNIPSTVGLLGYVPDATNAISSKTYTLKIWLNNAMNNPIAVAMDGKNMAFTFDATVAANFGYDDATNNNQESSRLDTPHPSFTTGAEPVQVVASKLVFNTAGNAPTNTNPQAQIGVADAFSLSSSQVPEVYALDADNNLDLNYNFTATISDPAQGFGLSSTSMPFVNGKLSLATLSFTSGSPTTLNTQIVVSGPVAPVTTPATSTNVWPVISTLTTITAGAAPTLPFSSLTTSLSTAVLPELNAIPNFNFKVTDDVGANSTTFVDNDALPTQFNTVVITQGPGNDGTVFLDWTKSIAGAELSLTNRNGVATSVAVTTQANVVVGPTSITFNSIPFGVGSPGHINDNEYNIYTLKIFLKNPVDPTIQDLIDNKNLVFSFDNTHATLAGGANATSEFAASSTNSGNVPVTVTATQLDFVTTSEWAALANEPYDNSLTPSPTAKAHDANQNLDLDWNTGNGKSGSVLTANSATYPLANTAVTLTNGVFTFDPTLRVTSAGNGIDGAVTNLVLSSSGLTSGNSNSFTLKYSANSDIIKDATFVHGAPGPNTYTQNILYANYQAASFASSTTPSTIGVALERFQIRDGGATHSDADGTATKVGAITLNISNGQYLRTVALYNGTTELAELPVDATNYNSVTGDLTFNSLTTPFATPVNSDGFITVYATFNSTGVVDNQIIQVKITSITATASSSQFNSPSGTSTTFATLGTNDNKIEVVATQIIYTTVPTSVSINVPLTVEAQAQDANLNLDADYNGAVSMPGAHPNGNTSDYTVLNLPTGNFVGGILDYPVPPPTSAGFQFTSGTVSTQLVVNGGPANTGGASVDAGAITGISPVITVVTSYESFVTKDPTFTIPAKIPYVTHQEGTLTGSSYELIRVLLLDGSRSMTSTYMGQPLQFMTETDTDGQLHGDVDGASTNLGSITVQISNPSDLRTIGLFDKNGVQLGSSINVAGMALTLGAAPQNFTFTGSPLISAPDDSSAVFSIRASFNNTTTTVRDNDDIRIQLISASIVPNSGSDFYNGNPANSGIGGPYPGGQAPSNPPSNSLGLIDVVATSLDFTTQPSTYAGINEPVGPTYTTAPAPSTSAGIVTARDKYALIDTDFAPTTIALQDANNNLLIPPAAFTFTNGVLNLDGMQYPVAVGNKGAVSVITTGPSLNSSVTSSGNSIVCSVVNVLDVSVVIDTNNGVVAGSGNPPEAPLKGGLQNQNIFGLKFTANATAGVEPKLKQFLISFKAGPNSPAPNNWFEDSNHGIVVFSGFNVFMNGTSNNVTSIGGSVSKVASGPAGYFDQILVDLSANPPSLGSGPLTFYLVVNVDASTNTSTQTLVPYFVDAGYGSPTDHHSIVSNGTSEGQFDGNEYSFASTQPPTLEADLSKYPASQTYPYAGQPNVDPAISQIVLQFDTNVGVLDNIATNQYTGELWSRFTNTKVADLILNTVVPVTPYVSPTTPASQGVVSNQTMANIYPKLVFDIVNKTTPTLTNDQVYFVKIRQGSYDPTTQVGHGIADYGLNFYGGITDNSTLYFKISSAAAINLTSAVSNFDNPSLGSLTTNFDQLGTAFYLIVKSGDPAPTKTDLLGTTNYATENPTATIAAPVNYGLGTPGSYQITSANSPQTYTFAANFVPTTTYDVYIFAQNDAQPTPVPAANVYSYPGLISGIVGGQPIATPNNPTSLANPNGTLLFTICADSYVTISNPMIIGEENSNSFFGAGAQDFNILLPTGYEFDVTVKPTVQLIGADFQPSGSPTWGYRYGSNTLLNVTFNNTGGSSTDYIVVSGLSIIGKSGSSQGNISWFYGNNVFTSNNTPVFTLAQITLNTPQIPDFTNTYWYNNQQIAPFSAVNSAANLAFQKTVNAIPDNYSDPNNSGAVRLLPITPPYSTNNTFEPGDFLASFFSGTGVSGDLLTLNAVPPGAAFNVVMAHTDLNGCATNKKEQYVVYDHNSPISKKLGVTLNSSIDAQTQQPSSAGTKQDLVNPNFPAALVGSIPSQTLLYNELAGYSLMQLNSDLPTSEIALNNATPSTTSQIISGSVWRNYVQNKILNPGVLAATVGGASYYNFTWDYGQVLKAQTPLPAGLASVYDYFKAKSPYKNDYWTGGSLGKVEFTGVYQSTADNSVYVPFRQDVELFVPAVPMIEVVSPAPTYDSLDLATTTSFNVAQYPTTNQIPNGRPKGGYPGVATFCEFGGPISLSGYPLATGGTSTGAFAMYDYVSFHANGVARTGISITASATSSSIVGVGTKFTVDTGVGSLIYDGSGNLIGKVKSIANDQSLTLQSFAAVALAGYSGSYKSVNPLVPLQPSHFVDNGNGTMTLDPTDAGIQNGFNDAVITYTYQDNISPAIGTGYLVIRITANPAAKFTISSTVGNPGSSSFSSFCVGSQITFDASPSILAGSNTRYKWDFGDPNSVKNNDTIPSPTHTYTVSNVYQVKLSLTSQWNCPSLTTTSAPVIQTSNVLYAGTPTTPLTSGPTTGQITVGNIPVSSFSITNNCVGDVITFDASASNVSGNSTISNYNWDFNSQLPVANGLPPPSPATAALTGPTGASTTYSKSGFYNVLLTTVTSLGCEASLTSYVSQLDVVSAFANNFDTNNGGWQSVDLSQASPLPSTDPAAKTSWVWNNTSGKLNSNFDTPSADKLWSTSGPFNQNEKSALYTACLNINVPRPMIAFSSYVDLNTGDGLVLQYSTDNLNIMDPKKSWTNLGTTTTGKDPGVTWFNAVGLPSTPGSALSNSTQTGWSGHGKWTRPKHKLDTVAGQSRVILRFAYSSLISSITANNNFDGVGIDSVFFGSRTRTILFENFTTTDDAGNSSLNTNLASEAKAITAFVKSTIGQTQLVNINYHVGFIGVDPFNLDDPADPSSRALYYNVNQVPYAFLDGIHYRDSTQTPPSDLFQFWGPKQYALNTLKLAYADFLDPSPSTKLTTASTNPDGSVQVDVNFTPVYALPYGIKGGTVLQVAILEKSVTVLPKTGNITTLEKSFGYVLKAMLPNAAGTKFTNPIMAGNPVSAGSFSWIPDKLYGKGDTLTVVAFLQNEDTKEVYQAFLSDINAPAPVTEIQLLTADNIKVYPNPADQEFTIELPAPAQESMRITVANQVGQFTSMGTIGEGEQSKRVSTQGLAEGVYILQLGSNGNALRTKVVVLHK